MYMYMYIGVCSELFLQQVCCSAGLQHCCQDSFSDTDIAVLQSSTCAETSSLGQKPNQVRSIPHVELP